MNLERYLRWSATPEFKEGVIAAKSSLHFNNSCPYTAQATGEQFDRNKLDAWFAGWFITTEQCQQQHPKESSP